MFYLNKTAHSMTVWFRVKSPSLQNVNAFTAFLESVRSFEGISVEMKVSEYKGCTILGSSSVEFHTREAALQALQNYAKTISKDELK